MLLELPHEILQSQIERVEEQVMREYSKVSPQFWFGQTGKALRKKGPEALVVGMYLMTAPNANMLGLYYLPIVTIAHETGLGFEGASKRH